VSEVRLAAARARARGGVAVDELSALATLESGLWRVVEAGDERLLTVAEDLQLHNADLAKLPAVRLSATQAKTLLAVLVATATGAAHPYPGAPATVADVLAVLGGPRLGEAAKAHVKGALKKLNAWRLATAGIGDAEVAEVGNGSPVRVGPAVAAWSGPWVTELTMLVAQVAGQGRRPR
jgi:hypothetical protein